MTDAGLCVLRHRQPALAAVGFLCDAHSRLLRASLSDFPASWDLLDHLASPGPSQGRTAKGADPPAPVRLDVVALRDRRTTVAEDGDPFPVLASVESWARLVREERGLTPPSPPATMGTEVAVLLASLPWICAQPWVDDFAADVRAAHASLQAVLGEHAPRPVGRCPAPVGEGECGGPLYADAWGAMRVSCGTCGDTWDEAELRRLGLVMGDG